MMSHSASVVIIVVMGFLLARELRVRGVRKKIFIFRIQILVHECQQKGFSFPPFSIMIISDFFNENTMAKTTQLTTSILLRSAICKIEFVY